jgi:hypothetical protein
MGLTIPFDLLPPEAFRAARKRHEGAVHLLERIAFQACEIAPNVG